MKQVYEYKNLLGAERTHSGVSTCTDAHFDAQWHNRSDPAATREDPSL